MKKIKRKKVRVGRIFRGLLCTLSLTFGSLCMLLFKNNPKTSMVCGIYFLLTLCEHHRLDPVLLGSV